MPKRVDAMEQMQGRTTPLQTAAALERPGPRAPTSQGSGRNLKIKNEAAVNALIDELQDARVFMECAVHIVTKRAERIPLVLNPAQVFVHEALERQRAETGRVRAIVLKARQVGSSTYVAARLLHRLLMTPDTSAIVLAHSNTSANHLRRSMYEFMYRGMPRAIRRILPNMYGPLSARLFSNNSSLVTAAAGSGHAGRGSTPRITHFSEAGYYEAIRRGAGEEIVAGALQAVPNMKGTEVIIESTSTGPQGVFYRMWQQAPGNGFMRVFVPWWMMPEFYMEPEPDFELSNVASEGQMSEAEYAEHHGLSLGQMRWRREKIEETGEINFKREYPMTPDEAFVSASVDSFIPAVTVMRAMQEREIPIDEKAPLIAGIDVAGKNDRTVVCWRRAGVVEGWNVLPPNPDLASQAEMIQQMVREREPSLICVDATGVGYQMPITLRRWNPNRVVSVYGNGKPVNQRRYSNKRAEMWGRARDWFAEENVAVLGEPEILSDLQQEILAHGADTDHMGRVVIEPKKKIKVKINRSPDIAEAFMHTFAQFAPAGEALDRGKVRRVGYINPHRMGARLRVFGRGN